MKRKIQTYVLAATLCITLAACGKQGGAPTAQEAPAQEQEASSDTEASADQAGTGTEGAEAAAAEGIAAVGAKIMVLAYEWGPGVPKAILELPLEADSVSKENAAIRTARTSRTVNDVYLSDENGNPAGSASKFITFDMAVEYKGDGGFGGQSPGAPFTYDTMKTFQNKWTKNYPVEAECQVTVGGEALPLTFDGDCGDSRITEAQAFARRGEKTGNYKNPLLGTDQELSIQWAAYEPESIAGGEKNPLLIWLHGQGEGGEDPEIAILGNEVAALARTDIQSYFTAGSQVGAYVLVPQCGTYWMDGGDGTNSSGDLVSLYTEILMDTIAEYVAANPDIDTERIYLGGCSNGGYMTINMLVNYPDYFAAAYPVCEAYAYNLYQRDEEGRYVMEGSGFGAAPKVSDARWFTEEKAQAIKDIPIWFVQSADDMTVNPSAYGLPTYHALLQAGAENCWYSLFENVKGTDAPDASYMGHFSWVYLFNDQVNRAQDKGSITADAEKLFGFVPSNEGGGSVKVGEYESLFAWLNDQKR